MNAKYKIFSVAVLVTLSGCGGSGGAGGSHHGGTTYTNTYINYDPAHSSMFLSAQSSGNSVLMQQVIDNDFSQIKRLGFTRVKTYYSEYCSGSTCISPAKEANKAGLEVALGVYEFPYHNYATAEVNAAITAAVTYPQTVKAIIVGNEDLNTQDGNGNTIGENIIADINSIKAGLHGQNVPIGTAQTTSTLLDPGSGAATLAQIVAISDFIGANVYPYFGGESESAGGMSAASAIPAYVANTLQPLFSIPVIVTEEGWPSAGINPEASSSPATASQTAQNDYFTTWSERQNSFASYYFQIYDMPNQDDVNNPNNYFGLCGVNGVTKSGSTFNC